LSEVLVKTSKVGNGFFFQIFALQAKIWKKEKEKECYERAVWAAA
jgi:hypothetical protein